MVTEIAPAALSADESARYLGIPRETFRRIAKLHIPGIRMGNRLVYRVTALDTYLAESEAKQHDAREAIAS